MLTWDTSNDVVKEGQDGRIVRTNGLVRILPVNRDVDILSSDRIGVTIICMAGCGAGRGLIASKIHVSIYQVFQ